MSKRTRPQIKAEDIKESDILPYDKLISNRGRDDTQLYLQRTRTERKLELDRDPGKEFNAPPWQERGARTMAQEREALYGQRGGGLQQSTDTYDRGGLSRNDQKLEYAGMNLFSRKKRREQLKSKHPVDEKTGGRGSRKRHRKKRRTFMAGVSSARMVR